MVLSHDRIISQRGEFWVHKSSLIPPLFIEVAVPNKENERSCICLLRISIFTSFYYISIEFWNCLDSVVFLVLDYIAIHGFVKTNATTKREKNTSLVLGPQKHDGTIPMHINYSFFRVGLSY